MSSNNQSLADFASEFSAAVISGGSSGIGAAFVSLLCRLNPDIRIFNLSRSKLGAGVPEKNVAFDDGCDLRDPVSLIPALEKVKSGVAEVLGKGRLLLVNNAGIASYGNTALSGDNSKDAEICEVNICAPVRVVSSFTRELLRSKGCVINMSSTAAFQPTPMLAVYGASKTFILNWSIALGAELEEFGCRVLAVCPGPTDTKFFKNSNIDVRDLPDKLGPSPAVVAERALEALRRRRRYCIIGLTNRVLIALSGLVPLAFSGKIAYMVMKVSRKTSAQS